LAGLVPVLVNAGPVGFVWSTPVQDVEPQIIPGVLADRVTVILAVPVFGATRRQISARKLPLTAWPTLVNDCRPYVTVETDWPESVRSETPTNSRRLLPEPTVCDQVRLVTLVPDEHVVGEPSRVGAARAVFVFRDARMTAASAATSINPAPILIGPNRKWRILHPQSRKLRGV